MIEKYSSDLQEVKSSIGLLISILVRFPEVASVKYTHKDNILHLFFMIRRKVDKIPLDELQNKLKNSIKVYHELENKQLSYLEFSKIDYDKMIMLEISRDLKTMNHEEINLMIGVMYHSLQKLLVRDVILDPSWEEDLYLQDDMIDILMAETVNEKDGCSLMGIREEGRVLVFNQDEDKHKREN